MVISTKNPSAQRIAILASLATMALSLGLLANINFLFHDNYEETGQANAISFPIPAVEHFKLQERAGDANLMISPDFVDPSIHCEFCPRIEYTPGQMGKSGVAYKSDKPLDLTGAKSVVFFARGEKGGEKVSFVQAGRDDTSANTDIFENKKFEVITEDIYLRNDWKKYQIDLVGTSLKDISYPFGFIVKGQDTAKIVFYLKAVTYDVQPAQNPLPTLQHNVPPIAKAGNQTVTLG